METEARTHSVTVGPHAILEKGLLLSQGSSLFRPLAPAPKAISGSASHHLSKHPRCPCGERASWGRTETTLRARRKLEQREVPGFSGLGEAEDDRGLRPRTPEEGPAKGRHPWPCPNWPCKLVFAVSS